MSSTDPRAFDQTRPLVMPRGGTLAGHDLHAGHPLTVVEEPKKAGEVTAEDAVRLWMNGKAVYADIARPTPVERPEDAARRGAEMDDLGGGWHLIRAPWLSEGIKVQGAEAAAEKLAEVITEGTRHYEDIVRGVVVIDPTPSDAPPSNGDSGDGGPDRGATDETPTTRKRRPSTAGDSNDPVE